MPQGGCRPLWRWCGVCDGRVVELQARGSVFRVGQVAAGCQCGCLMAGCASVSDSGRVRAGQGHGRLLGQPQRAGRARPAPGLSSARWTDEDGGGSEDARRGGARACGAGLVLKEDQELRCAVRHVRSPHSAGPCRCLCCSATPSATISSALAAVHLTSGCDPPPATEAGHGPSEALPTRGPA
eukprot:2991691-Rhodomonas_salina.3